MSAYELILESEIAQLKSVGRLYRHKKSGARVVTLQNDDENKVFSIGFRTPPPDSTGVPHIIEHSVLCGSREFPLKDPFVELVKGSLNTFLNAMTYPDKTIYPVASCNEKDFQNLMHVYLDAVFYPNIYEKEEIFRQEGWHYELDSPEGELTYNGVVYNEMKGAFSSPEDSLSSLIMEELYPDNCYGKESGGDPAAIPSLTYEQFLEFHRTYYHPSNSYLYLYGDMDMEEKLDWIDRHYLSDFDCAPVDSGICRQEPFRQMHIREKSYPVSEGESTEGKTYLNYSVVVGDSSDKELYLAMDILDYALLGMPGAPLKQALLEAGIGKDIISSFDNGIRQPFYSITAKNADPDQREAFVQCIRTSLERIASEGLQKESLRAALNLYEFRYREADFGPYPKGLMYGIQILDSWLYDENQPFLHLDAGDTYKKLKEWIDTGYFETLIRTYLLENTHGAVITLRPEPGLTTKTERAVKEKLAAYKASLSPEETEQIIRAARELKAYQEEPTSQEDLEKIPLLKREDIRKEASPLYNTVVEGTKGTLLHHNLFTNEIVYLKFLFDVTSLPEELIPYASLLTAVLGKMDTKRHTYQDLSNEINIHTGGAGTEINVYASSAREFTARIQISAKMLYRECRDGVGLLQEMILETKLDQDKRLREIIAELRSRMQMKLDRASHSAAINRGRAYFLESMCYQEKVDGIEFYRFIEYLDRHFEEEKEKIWGNLRLLYRKVFDPEKLLISLTCDEEGLKAAEPVCRSFADSLTGCNDLPVRTERLTVGSRNEGFKTSGQVQYVGRVGSFREAVPYTGAFHVLRMILGYDYLWNNVRVKGGAYGCMCGFTRLGTGYFVSYRDPNLAETNEIFQGIYDYVKEYCCSERDMTKNIIGTVSGLDTPMSPSAKGARSLTAWLSGLTMEQIQKERDELLSADAESIRALAPAIRAVLDQHYICVIGNETKIEENKELFEEISQLHTNE